MSPRVAVVTTTINVPHALKLYHAYAPDVALFVAGDLKTPEAECVEVIREINTRNGVSPPRAYYLSVETQKDLNYKCSELIGWNTISRRNIALLESIKWGAEVIILLDDDNFPLDANYFRWFSERLSIPFDGLKATSASGWFDVGSLLYADYDNSDCPHRGFPHEKKSPPIFSPTTNATIGVAAGICMGDPDISAVTRLERAPTVHHASKLLDAGIVVDPKTTRTVFNSQNTAFIRELAPCFLMVPQFQRYDDIFASIIAQRVMATQGLRVHFGAPFIWQQRNQHDLVKDLEAELWGMKHILNFSECVQDALFYGTSTLDKVRSIYDHLYGMWPAFPAGMNDLADAWLQDVESVL